MIAVKDLTMVYPLNGAASLTALRDVSFAVQRGEFCTIIGPSGCGKSTIINLLGGLVTPSGGEILIDGRPVTAPNPRRIAIVFQDYNLYPWRTVGDNVGIGLEFQGVARAERQRRVDRYLDLVGLTEFARHMPHQLSGGMQQRVAIARALSLEPEILLMDEPFGSLDEQTRIILGEQLSFLLSQTSKTIVFVTHSLAEAVFLSDRVVVLTARPGQVKAMVEIDETHPRSAAFMAGEKFDVLRRQLFRLLHAEMIKVEGQRIP
jgi:NitT/TauT family transport system ATP-binding protein